MASNVELQKLALELSEPDRAKLAADLLDSLPGILSDDDEGIAEALRRDAEMDASPDVGMSLELLESQIQAKRR